MLWPCFFFRLTFAWVLSASGGCRRFQILLPVAAPLTRTYWKVTVKQLCFIGLACQRCYPAFNKTVKGLLVFAQGTVYADYRKIHRPFYSVSNSGIVLFGGDKKIRLGSLSWPHYIFKLHDRIGMMIRKFQTGRPYRSLCCCGSLPAGSRALGLV